MPCIAYVFRLVQSLDNFPLETQFINSPFLIHGEADNNFGNYSMQSERYFNVLKGLGATVRLVMLPK